VFGGAEPTAPGNMPMGMGTGGHAPKKGLPLSFPVLMLIAVVVLLVFVVVAYFVFFKGTNANNAAKNSAKSVNATALSTLTNATLNPPADMTAFKSDSSTQSYYHAYLTKDATDNKACSLSLATYTVAQLPGADTNAIVAPQVAKLRELGATVHGPSAGKVLLIKDAASGSITYSMPTLDYEFSKDNKHASVHYSIVILKSGNRVEVSRQCADTNTAVQSSALSAIDTAASHITVTKQ
jgi:hypothetical protein